MDLPMGSVEAADPRRWRDRRTLVAIVAAVSGGASLGIVFGLVYGTEFVPVGGTIEIVDGFAVSRAIQVGGVSALIVAFACLLALRSGLLAVAGRRSLTRRRALIVGGIGTLAMIGPWFLIGLPIVTVAHIVGGHPESFPGELATRARSTIDRFYFFEASPALIGMVATFVAVAVIGSLFRGPSDTESPTDTPPP